MVSTVFSRTPNKRPGSKLPPSVASLKKPKPSKSLIPMSAEERTAAEEQAAAAKAAKAAQEEARQQAAAEAAKAAQEEARQQAAAEAAKAAEEEARQQAAAEAAKARLVEFTNAEKKHNRKQQHKPPEQKENIDYLIGKLPTTLLPLLTAAMDPNSGLPVLSIPSNKNNYEKNDSAIQDIIGWQEPRKKGLIQTLLTKMNKSPSEETLENIGTIIDNLKEPCDKRKQLVGNTNWEKNKLNCNGVFQAIIKILNLLENKNTSNKVNYTEVVNKLEVNYTEVVNKLEELKYIPETNGGYKKNKKTRTKRRNSLKKTRTKRRNSLKKTRTKRRNSLKKTRTKRRNSVRKKRRSKRK